MKKPIVHALPKPRVRSPGGLFTMTLCGRGVYDGDNLNIAGPKSARLSCKFCLRLLQARKIVSEKRESKRGIK